jgi:hypothetical protein
MVIGTVVVVFIIFAVFFYGAHKADKVVVAKSAAMREASKKSIKKANKG